jgi:hypothetical protein
LIAILLVLIMAMSTLGISASAATQTITFAVSNATIQVGGTTITGNTATTDANGNLTFNVVPTSGFAVTQVSINPTTVPIAAAPSATVPYNYTITGAAANATVTIAVSPIYAGQTATGDYAITTATQLETLAKTVNASATTPVYVGSSFTLAADIDLSGITSWDPIGGRSGETSYVPNGNFFGGFFSGSDGLYFYQITGLNINNAVTTNFSGWGLFGAASSASVIANVTLTSPSITISGSGDYIGGVVGYTQGGVYDSVVTNITLSATGSSNVGGIAGALEDRTATVVTTPVAIVEYSSVTGNITGTFEVGGVVGAVYAQANGAGNARVGYSSFTGGTVATTNGGSQSYVGGVVGWSKGWIANTYAANITLSTQGGHYLGGVVGRLNGVNPVASLFNSYSYVANWEKTDPNYDQAVVATMNNSNVLQVNSVIWYDDGTYEQSVGTGTQGWGDWTNYLPVYTIPGLNANVATLGAAFVAGPSYPILTWQASATGRRYVDPTDTTGVDPIPGGTVSYPDTDDQTMIFLDPNGTAGTGTWASPTNDLATALGLLTTTRNVIYVRNQVSPTVPITSSVSGAVIKRSSTYAGYLFSVTGATSVSSIIIDGNIGAFITLSPTNSLFYVGSGGTLTLGATTTLQNNYGNDGGAIYIGGGTVSVGTGTGVSGNTSAGNGGGISIHQSGTLTLDGGTISGNTAGNDGGGVAVYNQSTFTLTSGSISGNTATNNGGGIIAGSIASTSATEVSIVGGSVSSNKATNGGGIYVDNGTGPATTTLVTISRGDISGNTATADGGGIYITQSIVATTSGTIDGNTALQGGGVYVDTSGTFTDGGSTITSNAATSATTTESDGGGIYVAGTVTISGGSLQYNKASYSGPVGTTGTGNGGAIYIAATGSVTITSVTISGNTAITNGAGIYDNGTLTITPASGATFSITDVIYLATNTTVIGVGATIANITGTLTVQSVSPSEGLAVANGSGYTLVPSDATVVTYVGGAWDVALSANTLILTGTR